MCARPTPVPGSLPSPVRASPRLVPVPCSPSGRYQTASAVVSDASSSAVASTPLRLRLVPQPPRASTARPGSPRARAAALARLAAPPRLRGPRVGGPERDQRRALALGAYHPPHPLVHRAQHISRIGVLGNVLRQRRAGRRARGRRARRPTGRTRRLSPRVASWRRRWTPQRASATGASSATSMSSASMASSSTGSTS